MSTSTQTMTAIKTAKSLTIRLTWSEKSYNDIIIQGYVHRERGGKELCQITHAVSEGFDN